MTQAPSPPAAGSPSDAITEVMDKIHARADSVAETMIARYRDRIGAYANASEEVLDDARQWARASITVMFGIIKGDLDVKDFVDPLTEIGRRRAIQGFPLHDVLQANLIGAEVLWESVWDSAPDDPRDRVQVISTATTATIQLLQSVITALSNGYLEVESARVADEEYDMQTLVETLAGIREADQRHEERAQARGIDLGRLQWCIVGRSSTGEVGSHVRTLRLAHPDAVVGRIGPTIIGFFPGADPPAPAFAPIGIARAADPRRGYKRARATLQVAEHLRREAVSYEDVVPLAMLLGGPTEERAAFVEAQLGPLLRDQMGEDLVKSLDAYYSTGQSVAAAARELFVHRHTLEYRLARIETLLARDFRAPDERLLLELALAIRTAPA